MDRRLTIVRWCPLLLAQGKLSWVEMRWVQLSSVRNVRLSQKEWDVASVCMGLSKLWCPWSCLLEACAADLACGGTMEACPMHVLADFSWVEAPQRQIMWHHRSFGVLQCRVDQTLTHPNSCQVIDCLQMFLCHLRPTEGPTDLWTDRSMDLYGPTDRCVLVSLHRSFLLVQL